MRFNKIIYIRYIPLTSKIFKDFYMEEVIDTGIDVEYWDISALYFKHDFEQEYSSTLVKTIKFYSYPELESAIKEQAPFSDKLFISIMTFEGRIRKLYRLFTKYNCIISVFGRNMFPLPSPKKTSLPFILEHLSFSRIRSFFLTRRAVAEKRNSLIKPYDIMFLGGEDGWRGIGIIEEKEVSKAEIVKVNSDDYDNFLMIKDSLRLVNYEYILFLDEYLPLHPDTLLFDIKNLSSEEYYPQLNSYFDRVEAQYGMPVIIAAHPKGVRYKKEDFFNGRKVVFDKTGELSKHAHFIIAHDTTSINYPIAFGKRIHFITSENIYSKINLVHRNTKTFADFLGCNLQWFDREGPINLVEKLPEENYRNYKYKFQTSRETEQLLTKEIFITFLKK